MNWEAIGAIGELVGAIGVVVTLIYLAYQIRQNTEQLEKSTLAAKAAAQNASNEALRENRKAIFESPEMAEIWHHGNHSPETLDVLPKLRYRLIMQNVTEVMLEIYTQTLITSFSPETWKTQGVSLVKRVLATPGGQWFWASFADNYPAGFQAEVNRILSQE
ncbi:MAG: hypothetical protein OEW73_02610 [Gammaproteobacteria bacterium]|nr:hypothetical protein [Gammaproteobacteria bacterium]MDH5239657.1 hypothetical protein [Gammaproteobacteria bacterium]MDH5260096.1 hypothetical protein [Gammaproteobacteria bacterium]MDH5582237.1 hypothetical protein [Gammaproteobacteria bacterium]